MTDARESYSRLLNEPDLHSVGVGSRSTWRLIEGRAPAQEYLCGSPAIYHPAPFAPTGAANAETPAARPDAARHAHPADSGACHGRTAPAGGAGCCQARPPLPPA